jgi:peptide/nickel transport system substrate-binding protein
LSSKESKIPNNLRRYHYSTDDSFGARRWWFGLILALGLSACTAANPAPPPGTIRFSIAADPATLNPLFDHPDAASVEQQLARLVFEPFVDFDARGHALPALLQTIPTTSNGGISADGRTIIFHLRRNVRWSDGVPVTAGDVLFTLKAILDPRNPVRSREGYDLIDRAVARGSFTVALHLRRPWAPAATTYFSYGAVPQVVLPAHLLERSEPLERASFGAAPVGDGPYRLLWWRRGDGLRYVPNGRYWRGEPRAALDVRIAPDPSSNFVMLQSGQLDWNLIAPSQLAALRSNAALEFLRAPSAVVAAVRRCQAATCRRDVRRPPSDLAKNHAGLLPGGRFDPTAVLLGLRPNDSSAGLRSGRRRPAVRSGRVASIERRRPAKKWPRVRRAVRAVSRIEYRR